MSQYQKWPEEKYPKKCPVHNCYVFRPINSQNYQQNQMKYIAKPNEQIMETKNFNNQSPRQYNTYTQNDQYDPSLLLKQYASSDGVLRGYTNNYSFYESGTSHIKSNITINNQINNFTTKTFGQYPYPNRQISTTNNPSYIILEKEPLYYNYNTNYNNSNIGGFKYNEIQNQNINSQQRIYQAPKIEKRTVKRIVDKEPYSQNNTRFIQVPRNNYRNITTNVQNPMYQKINLNNNYRKYSGTQTNYTTSISNKRSISPMNPRPNIITTNYSRPIISQRKNMLQNRSNNNISFDSRANQYRMFTETNEYQSYNNNYPSANNYIKNNMNNINNRQREYASRTEFPEQRGYKYEYEQEDYQNEEDNEDEDDIYEVPVQYNNNYNNMNINMNNNRKEIYSERPFTRINNFSQMQKNRKRYGVSTQTLATNNNYYNNNEYEYEPKYENKRINNNYYSQPKYRQIPYGARRYTTQENQFTSFQRSLRNIRLNNEEIEMENDERNRHRVKIKTSGADNHRLYISNSYKRLPRRNYRTYTEQNAYRNQDYVLQELNDEDYEYAERNRYNNNLRIIKNENKMRQNYQNEEEVENDEVSDDEKKMYDNDKLTTAKNDNFKIMRQNANINEINNNKKEVQEDDDYINDEEGMPHDGDDYIHQSKKVKNIETEINEKYYDNQGNYLGEKKIITTKQVPIEQKNINIQKEGGEEEQEEIEEYESENYNENNTNEYIPYKSNNKHFKKRGENAQNVNYNINNNINERPSKYHSYFGDSANNVYYESKADSKEIDRDEKKYNVNDQINKQNIPINTNYGIQSENLCVPAEENNDDNEEKENENENDNNDDDDNDEKEADEQHIEENELFDDEDVNNTKNNNNNEDNDKKPNYDEINNNNNNNNNDMNNDKENNINGEENVENEENDDKERDELNNLENINEEANQDDEKNSNKDDKNITINKNVEIEIQNINNDIKNINNNENIEKDNNPINNRDEHNIEENEENNEQENENQNIQNEEQGEEEYLGEEEYVAEEDNENGEEMIEMEYEFDGNNEQEYEEGENNEGEEENENYENYDDIDKENIEYNENDNNIKKEE